MYGSRGNRLLCTLVLCLVAAACSVGRLSDHPVSGAEDSAAAGSDAAGATTSSTVETTTTTAVPERIIRVAIDALPANFNPYVRSGANSATWTATRTMWPQCLRLTPEVLYEPYFCESEPELVSTSPMVVEYRLRADAKWDDGAPVDADVLAWVHENCSAREGDCVANDGFDRSSLEIVDDRTVRLTFEEPFPDYRALFSTPMPPAHLGRDWGEGFAVDPGAATGPFALAERSDTELRLEPNPSWFGDPSDLDGLVLRSVEPGSVASAMVGGDIDLLTVDAETAVFEALAELPDLAVQVTPGIDLEQVSFQADGNRAMGDKFTRKAFAQALDRDEILAVALDGVATPTEVVTPGSRLFRPGEEGWADRAPDEYRAPDVDAALKDFRANGYIVNDQGILQRNGRPMRLRFVTTEGSVRRLNVARTMANQLAEVGIAVEIEELSGAELRRVIEARDFDLALFAWVGMPMPTERAYDRYRIAGQLNVGGYYDKVAHRYLSNARTALDSDSRRARLVEADTEMWDSIPNLPLYFLPRISAVRSDVVGFEPNPTVEGPLWNVEDITLTG